MSANSKALITGNRDGFAKILAEKTTGENSWRSYSRRKKRRN